MPMPATSIGIARYAGVLHVSGPSTPTTACCQSSSAMRNARAASSGSRSFSTRYAMAAAAAAM